MYLDLLFISIFIGPSLVVGDGILMLSFSIERVLHHSNGVAVILRHQIHLNLLANVDIITRLYQLLLLLGHYHFWKRTTDRQMNGWNFYVLPQRQQATSLAYKTVNYMNTSAKNIMTLKT